MAKNIMVLGLKTKAKYIYILILNNQPLFFPIKIKYDPKLLSSGMEVDKSTNVTDKVG